ncbi:Rhodanese-like domain-containing protein [Podospora appendiculata]|uniref:Rhodanese-like domain-containing protein n=1 Tax=Podospora appendiculata TaxID=314037 RepID=A0AAE0WZZ8_9PEZI|nr:Rhodanese-like domain-containing protein [Podospora appendiculata]
MSTSSLHVRPGHVFTVISGTACNALNGYNSPWPSITMLGSLALLAPALAGLLPAAAAATLNTRTEVVPRTFTPLVCLVFSDVVSPWWVNKCKDFVDLVVIDLRDGADYATAHIPGSVSAPFTPVSAWSSAGNDNLILNIPAASDLFATLTSLGVSNPNPATKIVLVNGVDAVGAFSQAASPRVATTLKTAGISDGRVAILDGGFPAWAAEFHTTTVVPAVTPRTFTSTEDRSFLVNISYVAAHVNRKAEGIYLIDGRDTSVYNGSVMESWALKPGHIPSAVSLPAVKIWNADGSFKNPLQLLALVRGAVGFNVSRTYGQIIVYCGVGGYASSWYFVLTRVLGFENVVFYDGSAQEWSQYYDMEL